MSTRCLWLTRCFLEHTDKTPIPCCHSLAFGIQRQKTMLPSTLCPSIPMIKLFTFIHRKSVIVCCSLTTGEVWMSNRWMTTLYEPTLKSEQYVTILNYKPYLERALGTRVWSRQNRNPWSPTVWMSLKSPSSYSVWAGPHTIPSHPTNMK